MITDDLLFIEPREIAAEDPLLDELTGQMAAAFRSATPPTHSYCGFHVCSCGAHSLPHDLILPNGLVTNSLCVHYLAYHRSEVRVEDIAKIRTLGCGVVDPSEYELHGPRLVSADGSRLDSREIDVRRTRYQAKHWSVFRRVVNWCAAEWARAVRRWHWRKIERQARYYRKHPPA